LGHLIVRTSIPSIHRKPDRSRLRASAVATHASGLALVVAAAWVAREAFELSHRFPFTVAAIFAVVALATLWGLPAHPFSRFGLANTVTTFRASLASLVLAATAEPAVQELAMGAALTSLAAAAFDGADGWAARRSGMSSAFGARFDMEVDALLVLALSLLAWRSGRAGAWIVAAGTMRYLFVAAGWMWSWLKQPLPPSRRRQAVCVLQVVGMGTALVPGLPPMAAWMLLASALLILSYSFSVDIAWLWRRRTALGGVALA
jgi:phosphatidylglycerophosphate synthase